MYLKKNNCSHRSTLRQGKYERRDFMQKYKCRKCGYETENEVAEQEKILRDGLCYQCWLDRDCPSQEELEQRY